ncbi:hypothetical protein J5N97_013785 [Dioscorea zingiberensis]|uniref:Uncharacterized protein n=1 Tax=Dioscorea zingiberensis TaxID=325984 RepID=A0A9D5CRG2_9LILI|nr:hypothetical protein J5N97_013785 [Dioscorea zingiberensis]
MIKSTIMTTASTLGGEGLPIADEKSNTYDSASFFTMGAGLVNPNNGNEPGLVYDIQPDEYIAYLCGLKLSNFKIQAIIRHPIKCSTIQKLEPEQLNYPSISVQLDKTNNKDKQDIDQRWHREIFEDIVVYLSHGCRAPSCPLMRISHPVLPLNQGKYSGNLKLVIVQIKVPLGARKTQIRDNQLEKQSWAN